MHPGSPGSPQRCRFCKLVSPQDDSCEKQPAKSELIALYGATLTGPQRHRPRRLRDFYVNLAIVDLPDCFVP